MTEINLDPVVSLLFNLTKVISATKMYSRKHPAVVAAAQQAYSAMEEILKAYPEVTIGTKEGTLLVEETPITQHYGPLKSLANTLTDKGIHSFTVKKGATLDELVALAEITTLKESEILVDGEVRPEIRQRFHHIDINILKYKLISGDGEDALGLKGDGGEPGGAIKTSPAAIAEVVSRNVSALLSSDLKVDPEELKQMIASSLNEVFFELAGDQFDGFASLRNSLMQVVLLLSPEIQLSMFGKRIKSSDEVDLNALFPQMTIEQKAKILAKDTLNPDVSREDLTDSVKSLAGDQSQVVILAEAITKQIGALGKTARDRRRSLTKFFDAVRSSPLGEGPKYTAVIVADDPDTNRLYKSALPGDRFRAVNFTNAIAARTYIQSTQPDLVIADNTLSSQTGLAVITLMYHADMQIPLIACADYPEFAQKEEVRGYPAHKFLLSPVPEDRLRHAIEEFYPLTTEEVEKRDDLKRARQIQEKLLPDSLPKIAHYDVSGFYKACKEIGGDYYDLFPLSDTKFGILVADVSGKGISGALVMVMFRSMFRITATADMSPKETMLKVNDMLTADIRKGMFVTALYMQLDTAADTLVMCSAGHNPAVFWRATDIIKPQLLIPSGMALGVTKGRIFENAIKERTIHLIESDRVFLYTDGVVEAMNDAGEELGSGRLLQIIARSASRRSSEVVNEVVMAVDSHKGTAEQHDDITILTFTYTTEEASQSFAPIFSD